MLSMIKQNKWTFTTHMGERFESESFPFAFRHMYNFVDKSKSPPGEVRNGVSITSPEGKVYTYAKAIQLAEDMELLTNDGINRREFKKRR